MSTDNMFSWRKYKKRYQYFLVTKMPYLKLNSSIIPVSIFYKFIASRYRPVRVADGPITARYRFIKTASWYSYSQDGSLATSRISTLFLLMK